MFQTLPGFRDFYPETCAARNAIFNTWRKSALAFNFQEYDTPILEELSLFTQKSGEEIKGQLFCFNDKGDRQVTLRPEMTPSLARILGAKFHALPKPIKWFSIGEQFRYERPQKGRLRSFYQFNADIIGESSVAADAECIALLVHTLSSFGLTPDQIQIHISDRQLWYYYLEHVGVPAQAVTSVLSLIDKLDEGMPQASIIEKLAHCTEGENVHALLEAIQALRAINSLESLEMLITSIATHAIKDKEAADTPTILYRRLEDWKQLMHYISAYNLGAFISIDFKIVRGLAYYTGFVFEAFERFGQSRALAGGGRYDDLLQKLMKVESPAVGFAIGDVTLMDLLNEQQLLPSSNRALNCYVIIESEAERAMALADMDLLRRSGYTVDWSLKQASLNKQLKQAFALNAEYALIYGEIERIECAVTIRNLQTRVENKVSRLDLRKDPAAALGTSTFNII